MAVIYLLRHAHSVANGAGILAGRSVGNPLSQIGERQANQIARSLQHEKFSAIYASPLQRCLQTVDPLAQLLHRRIRRSEDFLEMNYGDWTGQSLSELRRERFWREVQKRPSGFRFPNGESFLAAQRRIIRGLNQIEKNHGKDQVLVVTHGDVIKIALASALEMELDDFQRLIVDPASISVVDWGARVVLQVNSKIVKSRTEKSLKSRSAIGGGTNV